MIDAKPYVLAGPIPDYQWPDVKALMDMAVRRNLGRATERGLVLRITGVTQSWFISFYETNIGEHKFHEMSGDGMVFRRGELAELLDYLGEQGFAVSPQRPPAPIAITA